MRDFDPGKGLRGGRGTQAGGGTHSTLPPDPLFSSPQSRPDISAGAIRAEAPYDGLMIWWPDKHTKEASVNGRALSRVISCLALALVPWFLPGRAEAQWGFGIWWGSPSF